MVFANTMLSKWPDVMEEIQNLVVTLWNWLALKQSNTWILPIFEYLDSKNIMQLWFSLDNYSQPREACKNMDRDAPVSFGSWNLAICSRLFVGSLEIIVFFGLSRQIKKYALYKQTEGVKSCWVNKRDYMLF